MQNYYVESFCPTGTQADKTYGRRIYIHSSVNNEEVLGVLDRESPWRGSDRSFNGWLGWELPLDIHEAIQAVQRVETVLHQEGFSRVCIRPWRLIKTIP